MRSLSPEEAELWARVTASIAPLSREKPDQEKIDVKTSPAEAPTPPPRSSRAAFKPSVRPAPASRKIGTTLDGTWDRRLSSGSVEPDRVLDLHGMNLDRAWQAIDHALDQAIGRGERILLLITGHHRPGEPPIKRGLIRAAVNDWLVSSRHANQIAAVRGAHRRHGGGGSLYIVLRRRS